MILITILLIDFLLFIVGAILATYKFIAWVLRGVQSIFKHRNPVEQITVNDATIVE